MKLTDLKNGGTWVVGIQGFDTAMFIRGLTARECYSRFPWRWTGNLLLSSTFASREDAEQFRNDARFGAFLADTLLQPEITRVRVLKVELRVGV